MLPPGPLSPADGARVVGLMPGLVSIVIPAFNEAATIDRVVAGVLALEFDLEVLVVDDGSSDATAEAVRRIAEVDPRVRLISHARNAGKGAAVRTGIAASRGDVVAIQDADVEYDPSELPTLIAPILRNDADAVYGTRLRGGRLQRAHLFWHYLGNQLLSSVTRMVFNTTISDVEVGSKAFYGPLVRSFPLQSHDFRFEIEVTARTLRTPGIRLYETPVSYYGRSFAEGKKITWVDGLRALGAIIRFARVARPDGSALVRPAIDDGVAQRTR